MSTLVFIGGATASGKTSLIKLLSEQYPDSITYRRVQGFYDLAKIKSISKQDAFSQIDPIDVDNYFVSICEQNDLIFSDVHYAVQMNRSKMLDIYETYVPTISDSLISKLKLKNIRIVPIFLECSPKVCLERAKIRYKNGQKELRDISVKDAEIESLSEKREFYNLMKKCDNGQIINSEINSPKDIAVIISELILEDSKRKSLIKERE